MIRILLCSIGFLAFPAILSADVRSVENWLDQDLLPFLENRLGRHPRLKGQAFELVVIKDLQPEGRIDGLTAHFRQRIIDHLDDVPGANLALKAPAKPWLFRQHLREIACELEQNAQIQVTIEIARALIPGEIRIVVRAIDLLEKEWVRGFKKVWTGKPSARERQLIDQQVLDQNLIGSRAHPFQNDQPDLLASYLAERLSCMLKQTGERSIKLLLPRQTLERSKFFHATFELLDHYLSRFQEVKIVSQSASADVMLSSKIVPIKSGLYQISVLLNSVDDSIRILGLGSEAYVQLSEFEIPNETKRKASLIKTFQLIAPLSSNDCTGLNAWKKGYVVLTKSSRLPSEGCFAIRFKAAETGKLYLLSQTDDGRLIRLFPDSCDKLDVNRILKRGIIRKDQLLHVPLFGRSSRGYFQLDHSAGVEKVYAIVVNDRAIESKLNRLIKKVGDLCQRPRRLVGDDSRSFKASLINLEKASRGGFEWMEQSFRHY